MAVFMHATERLTKKLRCAISPEKHHIYKSLNHWRSAILSAFGYDPLKCSCGATMLFLELYFNHQRVSLEEILCPPPRGPFSIQESAAGGLSYK